MSHDCATVNQYHNAILQFNGVLSLFTTGSNTTALPDNAGRIVAAVFGYGATFCYVAVFVVVVGFRVVDWLNKARMNLFEGKCYSNMTMNVDGKLPNSTKLFFVTVHSLLHNFKDFFQNL